jgi:hypothetical protein
LYGFADPVRVKRGPSAVTGDLARDEPAERDTDRSCAEAGAIRGPCLVVDLYSRHPIARTPRAFLCSVFALSSSSSHVYVVDDVADALKE